MLRYTQKGREAHEPMSGRHPQRVIEKLRQSWDVIVVGGGNAALVGALSARACGARVLVLERTDKAFRGGNSRHTRNIRCVHDSSSRWNTGAYTQEQLWKDLCGVGRGPSNEALAELTVRESESVPSWMNSNGAHFQQPLAGTLHLGRTNTFFLGGGKALINSYYRRASSAGVETAYEARVDGVEFEGNRCTGLVVDVAGTPVRTAATNIVVASGGFEANIEWLSRYWGAGALNYHIRGPRTNDGAVLARLIEAGAASAGDERGFHSVAVDARSPKFDGGIATRLDAIPFGVVVNKRCERFYDEGEDVWPKRYAIWGGKIAGQPDQIAYAFWDSKVKAMFLPPMYGAFSAATIDEVATQMGLDGAATARTVQAFNDAVAPDAVTRFDPTDVDGLSTRGLTPPKTNWALPIDTAPFFGIPMRPGVTFTYMGVEVGQDARIRKVDGSVFENVFAAGEIMSGNILSTGYLAGFGMTIGTVWGRIAGREAAAGGPH